MARYRFAFSWRWILFHLLMLGLVVLMINLGFWQLRRLHGRQDANRGIRAAEAAAPQPVDELVHVGDPTARGEQVGYRSVTATGTYVTADEFIVNARALGGRPGVWVLTPLRLSSGAAVVVLRGFVPSVGPLDGPPPGVDPPSGTVTVTGIIQPTAGSPAPPGGEAGHALDRPDVERIAGLVGYPVLPVYVQLQASVPAQAGELPQPLPLPTLDDGPHLAYAGQWFLFTAIVLVGYPLVLRRQARQREKEQVADGRAERDGEAAPEPVNAG